MAHWVGVVSKEHALQAVEGGFFQSNHGKRGPVAKMSKGDHVLFYSPRERKSDGAPLKAFVAVGEIIDEKPQQVAQSSTFSPFRRNVRWFEASEAPIRPLLDELDFTRGNPSWGLILRRGLFQLSDADYGTIAQAMDVADR